MKNSPWRGPRAEEFAGSAAALSLLERDLGEIDGEPSGVKEVLGLGTLSELYIEG